MTSKMCFTHSRNTDTNIKDCTSEHSTEFTHNNKESAIPDLNLFTVDGATHAETMARGYLDLMIDRDKYIDPSELLSEKAREAYGSIMKDFQFDDKHVQARNTFDLLYNFIVESNRKCIQGKTIDYMPIDDLQVDIRTFSGKLCDILRYTCRSSVVYIMRKLKSFLSYVGIRVDFTGAENYCAADDMIRFNPKTFFEKNPKISSGNVIRVIGDSTSKPIEMPMHECRSDTMSAKCLFLSPFNLAKTNFNIRFDDRLSRSYNKKLFNIIRKIKCPTYAGFLSDKFRDEKLRKIASNDLARFEKSVRYDEGRMVVNESRMIAYGLNNKYELLELLTVCASRFIDVQSIAISYKLQQYELMLKKTGCSRQRRSLLSYIKFIKSSTDRLHKIGELMLNEIQDNVVRIGYKLYLRDGPLQSAEDYIYYVFAKTLNTHAMLLSIIHGNLPLDCTTSDIQTYEFIKSNDIYSAMKSCGVSIDKTLSFCREPMTGSILTYRRCSTTLEYWISAMVRLEESACSLFMTGFIYGSAYVITPIIAYLIFGR